MKEKVEKFKQDIHKLIEDFQKNSGLNIRSINVDNNQYGTLRDGCISVEVNYETKS